MISNFFKTWWPTGLTLAVILWLTLWPDPTPDMEIPSFLGEHADKIVHAIMMGWLTGAIIFDMKRRGLHRKEHPAPAKLTVSQLCVTAIAVTAFSIGDEILQTVMDYGRSGDVFDFLADITGMVIALAIAPGVVDKLLNRYVRKHK